MGATLRTALTATLVALLMPLGAAAAAPAPAPSASGATLAACTQADPQPAALRACVDNERRRAANLLRETNQTTLVAVNQQTQREGRHGALRAFQLTQARHVRWRQTQCRGQGDEVARSACEADADFAQITRLQQLAGPR